MELGLNEIKEFLDKYGKDFVMLNPDEDERDMYLNSVNNVIQEEKVDV